MIAGFLHDCAYALAALVSSPLWAWRLARTGKWRTDWPARFGRVSALPRDRSRPRILLHAVSVGEVNAIRLLVDALAAHPRAPEIVVATTTDTGFARATSLFGGRHAVVRYPFDASRAVARFLDAVRPDVVGLVELEVWPNFVRACAARGIQVAVVNGRLSERSFGRYRLARPLLGGSFRRLAIVSAQTEEYAERFRAMGAPRVVVGGTMKWDTAEIADRVPGADALATTLGVDRSRPLVVAGSTEPGEEALLRAALPAGAQLLVAPRKPEWFDAAAQAMAPCTRRSDPERDLDHRTSGGRFLLDSIGELRAAYALADVVVVGRSFGRLYGSDMMEPVALGKPTIVGPRVADFRETVEALEEGRGIVRTDAAGLPAALDRLLADPDERRRLAEAGRRVIRARQGATKRNAAILVDLLRPAAALAETAS